ncbi:MAG: TFIIB-type zinc ribbon-containing protein [Planctomycetota bacterium]|jgi:phage FluMu protein Com
MIEFRCKNCGQKIRAPEVRVGHKGKCPRCKNVVLIPRPEQVQAGTNQTAPPDSQPDAKNPYADLSLLDIPEKNKPPDRRLGENGPAYTSAELSRLEQEIRTEQIEPAPKRKFPWLIDIFFYPVSVPGLTVLGIIIGVPLLFRILVWRLTLAMLKFPPLLVFALFFGFAGFAIRIVFLLYLCWYFCECIRDSAGGGLRAPDVLTNSPGLGDMFWQTLRAVGCLAFFFAPMGIYYLYTKRTDAAFQVLLACAAFFLPMGLLAVIMFDSFSGLNPVLLIGSIFSTFFPYCAMVSVFFVACFLGREWTPDTQQSPLLAFLLVCAYIYLIIVATHILGWFYHRYQERLNWEV